jgi:hypothetical protein
MDGMQGPESEEGRSLPVPDLKPKRIQEQHKVWSFEDTFQISCSEGTQADGPGDLQQNPLFFIKSEIDCEMSKRQLSVQSQYSLTHPCSPVCPIAFQ